MTRFPGSRPRRHRDFLHRTFFDRDYYICAYPDVAESELDPFEHYMQYGWREGRNPSGYFQSNWYLRHNKDVAAAGLNPLTHFITDGEREGRRPNQLFDPIWYGRRYRNEIPANVSPFLHFVTEGAPAGNDPGPYFSCRAYRERYMKNCSGEQDAVQHFLSRVAKSQSDLPHLGMRLVDVLALKPCAITVADQSSKLAVHAHIFYPELAPEIAQQLSQIPTQFDLFVSTTDERKKARIYPLLKNIAAVQKLDIRVVQNRGRDIAPFILTFGKILAEYDLVLHLHSKRSVHNAKLDGWRSYLFETLLGSSQNVAAIIRLFTTRSDLGVLHSPTYYPVEQFMRDGGNAEGFRAIASRAGLEAARVDPMLSSSFPAGSMFWARGEVIRGLVDLSLELSDFAGESGQTDGTLAHALERCIPMLASARGLETICYVPSEPSFHPWLGLWRLNQHEVCADTLLIDHDIGGGTNAYTNTLVSRDLALGRSIARIYYDPLIECYVCQIGNAEGTRYYHVPDPYLTIKRARVSDIIVNSCMDFDADQVAAALDARNESLAKVTYMVHDFHLLCPSQHLLDADNLYCNLPPIESSYCRNCFKSNDNILPNLREDADLGGWRASSQALIDLCDEVRFFDSSGAELFTRALTVAPGSATVRPHASHRKLRPVAIRGATEPHVAFFGTMTFAKGAVRLNELAHFIRSRKLPGKITVVGQSTLELDPFISVTGSYEPGELPERIEKLGVNVLFLSSIVPETFSFTLSEAMQLCLPTLVFDVGAQGRRATTLRNCRAIPLHSSPRQIYEALTEMWEAIPTAAQANDDCIHLHHQKLSA